MDSQVSSAASSVSASGSNGSNGSNGSSSSRLLSTYASPTASVSFSSGSSIASSGGGPTSTATLTTKCPSLLVTVCGPSPGPSSASTSSVTPATSHAQAVGSTSQFPGPSPLSSNGQSSGSGSGSGSGIAVGSWAPGRGLYAASLFEEFKRRQQPEMYIKNLQAKLVATRAKLYNQEHQLSKEGMLVVINELQRLYRELLLLDLDVAVNSQLEHLMWNDCFKKPLAFLKPLDASLFHFVLENGVGFYLAFIQELGCHFDVSFIRNSAIPSDELNIAKMKPVIKCSPSKAVVYYVIQSSLVHVGDLLRYRGSLNEALKMYDKSTAVSPTYGHPFNQMGLVQVMINDKELDSLLTALYCYTRAICVANPFLAAQKNLEELIMKVIGLTAMPEKPEDDAIIKFFRMVVEILNPCRNIYAGEQYRSLPFEIRVELFTFSQLFRVLSIALWVYKRESDKKLIGVESNHEAMALELIINLLNGITATGCIELKTVADFVGLSHLNILLEWLRLNTHLLQHPIFRAKIHVGWLCRAANQVLKEDHLCRHIASDLYYVILPEEKRLLGFLPMRNAYDHLQSVMADADPRIIALRINRLSKLMEYFSKPEYFLLARFGQLYQPVIFSNMDPRELFPQRSDPRPSSTLQSIFNQFGAPISDPQITIIEPGRRNSGIENNRPKRGLMSETLAKVMEKERQQESRRYGQHTPTPMEQLSIESIFSSSITSDMSPTPLTEDDSESRPSDTDFSKVFQSIWTPFSQDAMQETNNLWKF